MKKAKILTFHFVTNYGAILQTTALYNTLKKYYDEVEILNYIPQYMNKEEKLISFKSIKAFIDTVYSMPTYFKRKKNFSDYRKKFLKESPKYISNELIKDLNDCDIYIGSDQVWNLGITNKDKTFLGKFENTNPKSIFSYAASFGVSELNDEEQKIMKEELKNFSLISVREETGKLLLENISLFNVNVVLDPTLLLDKDEWVKIYNIKECKNNDFIFLYTLTANSETIKMAEEMSKKLNLPIIEVSGKRQSLKRIPKHKIKYSTRPEEFVQLLNDAAFVVTDSFHATVFSIIFEKRFVTTKHKTRGSRIIDLLNKVDLINNYTNECNDDLIKEINFKDVKNKLSSYKKGSIKYIEECVKLSEENS